MNFNSDKRNEDKWEVLNEKTVYESFPWIRVDAQKIKLPSGNIVEDYHRVILPQTVVVYPTTIHNKILMLETYRHGIGCSSLLFPGGIIDNEELPIEAAKRELLEETGYSGDAWEPLGSFIPHSNYGSGKVHIFKAENLEKSKDPSSGDLEKMEITLYDQNSLLEELKMGRIKSLGSAITLLLGSKSY